MSNAAEKELEETLEEVGNSLLAPPSDVDELLSLLDQVETFLSRVEQSPPESMSVALHPAMKGLIAKELLGHSDEDVKVAVASCISEITRITAPEAPYDDGLMKEIFQMIVKAFEKLDDVSSSSYPKRVSILETVAKVRSCVVMLDLECDALILEMFQHFLRTVRDNHPENVLSSMELVMTLVLEESEDISPELLSSLLTSVKKDAMDVLPIARRLAEKVISNCALKLKPCLMEAVQSLGAPLSDYSKVVATVCQESSDVLEHNGLNASGECLADDSKFSERTVSDELAQGSGKLESEVSCPEVGTASGRSPRSVMSNGVVQAGNDGCLVEPTSLTKKNDRSQRRILLKHASAARTERLKLDTLKDTSSNHSNKKSKIHKNNAAVQFRNMNDTPQIIDDKGGMALPNKKRGHSKEPESSRSECPSIKEMEISTPDEHRKGVEPQASLEKLKQTMHALSPSLNADLSGTSRPKRGRPARAKVSSSIGGTGDSGSDKAKVITDTAAVASSNKQIEGTSALETKSGKRSGKKQSMKSVDDVRKLSPFSQQKREVDMGSDEERMLLRKHKKSRTEVNGGDSSGRRQASKSKQQKSRDSSDNEMVASPKMVGKADKGQIVEKSLKTKPGKKRAKEQDSRTPGDALKYDESIVGANIKVWWPDDAKFYQGTVDSYDPISKKHKVSYFDGDEETLLMKNERFVFTEVYEDEEEIPVAASEMSRKKAKKSDSSLKKIKTPVSSKRDGIESEAKHDAAAAKPASGRRGRPPKLGDKTEAITGSKSKERANAKPSAGTLKKSGSNKSIDGTPEYASKSNSQSKPGRKHKHDTPASGRRSKDDASRPRSKGKDGDARSGNTSTSEAGKYGRKSKEDNTTKAVQKPKSASNLDSGIKSDGEKDKVGSSRGQEAQDAAAKVSPASRRAQENEAKSGKKRMKRSQS